MKNTGHAVQPTRLERLGDNLVAFCLNSLFITDNKLLFMAPRKDFCRTCFRRRYATQLDGGRIVQVGDSVIRLAGRIDAESAGSTLWRWFLVDGGKVGKPFELIPYEDCPDCGKEQECVCSEAVAHYGRLMGRDGSPELNILRDRIFSFGFARGLLSDNQIGEVDPALGRIQPELSKILGDSHHARIIYRIITPDGRYVDETCTGIARGSELAHLKATMEYLERYAFFLDTCSLKTSEHDSRITSEFLTLYREPVNQAELSHIQSHAYWGINLCTGDVRAIPRAFISAEGRLRYIQPTTNGFAAHVDYRKSLCGRILELVERDAFVRFWHDPERIYKFDPDADVQSEIDSISSVLGTVAGNNNLESACFIVKSPTGLPVVMVTISSRDFSRPPSLCFGYGVGFDIPGALSGALKELKINAGNLVKAITFIDGYLEREFPSNIESAPDRMNFYSTSIPRDKLRFLDSENPLLEGIVEAAAENRLEVIVDRFRRIGFDIYGLDFTPGCFQDTNVFVTRAFSPQLYPLQSSQENAFNLAAGPGSAHHGLPHFFI